ncbi:TAXI family TRAP transporter solute-binding subunit [Rhodocyclus tenuis]|uniref:TAXI family TRAP transporter solute-binding subunit n=1 Tax=Rhodocyclus tenuis TaxID=1066 RepID=UPI0019042682|nr:TAXI family TRAP transporter solute-binding subunit [Rhodocyclus tenuis]MBK1681299.1 C4-dicarboxylate ABC transporter substrate-binding protein [Rhodocyclus tenuis]
MSIPLRERLVTLRALLATAWPIIVITAAGFMVAYQFVQPAPPSHLSIATGGESGAYYAFAKRYATILARNGITVDVQTSAGSVENIERLRDGRADVAFVQGGSLPPPVVADDEEADTSLQSLGSAYLEPVWVFYRGASVGEATVPPAFAREPLERLHQLAGRRIAVGAEGSGIRGLALQLLEANEVPINPKHLLPLAGLDAAAALQQGRIDAAFVIAAPEAAVVQVLLRSPGVRVMNFVQADAYTRRFPFLSRIVLPQGTVDLVRENPPRDTVLLATTANIVAGESLHPALASLLLQAMREVHGGNGFFQRAGDFPAWRDQSFPLLPDARRFYESGPPFLQRFLPFWLAVLVERLVVLLLPLLGLLLPLMRFAPSLYAWRVRSKLFRCYGELKFLENELDQPSEAARRQEIFARLDAIEDEARRRSVPLAFANELYTLREHINLVRRKLRQHAERAPDAASPASEASA